MKKTKRQQVETTFHDNYAKLSNANEIKVNDNFSLAYQEARRALSIFGDLRGKRVLDLGCGFGETAVFWALKGADIDAIDISSEMVTLAKKLARKHKVGKNCQFQQMAAESLNFADNSFDYVFGDGILHHVDINPTLREIHRVMKKGGRAVFIEPLAYNPAINLYRRLATDVRTPTEKPLKFKDIHMMEQVFTNVNHKEYHFFTLLIFLWFYLMFRIHPNKQRYWIKFRELRGLGNVFVAPLVVLDQIALNLIPPLRYLCWNTVIILKK